MENIERKGEIACNKQFLLFSQCFLPYLALTFYFKCFLKCLFAICFNLDQSEVLPSGNVLSQVFIPGSANPRFDDGHCDRIHSLTTDCCNNDGCGKAASDF